MTVTGAIQLEDIRADRRLLYPGPLAPLSHFGATLLRYVQHTSLRYAFYQLGIPAPEAPATRFVGLRVYYDGPKLDQAVPQFSDRAEVLGALLDPGGSATAPLSAGLSGALWFHRLRGPRRPSPTKVARRLTGKSFTDGLSLAVPWLGEALLAELAASLRRRQKPNETQVQSREAHSFLTGRRTALECLGPPDPRVASWATAKPPGIEQPDGLACPPDRSRGGFRELYRLCLDSLRIPLLDLAAEATRAGVLASKNDLFFIPMDLLRDIEGGVNGTLEPTWLEQTIADNRAEWQELANRRPPAETLGNVDVEPRSEIPTEFACLTPLL